MRDLQESFGWQISFINDKYERGFHKTCYNIFLSIERQSDPSPSYLSKPTKSKYHSISKPKTVQTKKPSQDLDAFSTYLNNPSILPSRQRSHVSSTQDVWPRDLDKEFEEINPLWDFKEEDKRFTELAEAYFYKGDREKALKISFGSKTQEALIVKIALSYYEEGNIDTAFKIIKKIPFSDSEIQDSFIAKIADDYLSKGDRENAFKVTEKTDNISTKNAFIAKIALSYFLDHDDPGVLNMVRKIAQNTLMGKLLRNAETRGIFLAVLGKHLSGFVYFFIDLAKTCFEQTKEHFVSQDSEAILQGITDIATDQSIIKRFLDLKKE